MVNWSDKSHLTNFQLIEYPDMLVLGRQYLTNKHLT